MTSTSYTAQHTKLFTATYHSTTTLDLRTNFLSREKLTINYTFIYWFFFLECANWLWFSNHLTCNNIFWSSEYQRTSECFSEWVGVNTLKTGKKLKNTWHQAMLYFCLNILHHAIRYLQHLMLKTHNMFPQNQSTKLKAIKSNAQMNTHLHAVCQSFLNLRNRCFLIEN